MYGSFYSWRGNYQSTLVGMWSLPFLPHTKGPSIFPYRLSADGALNVILKGLSRKKIESLQFKWKFFRLVALRWWGNLLLAITQEALSKLSFQRWTFPKILGFHSSHLFLNKMISNDQLILWNDEFFLRWIIEEIPHEPTNFPKT